MASPQSWRGSWYAPASLSCPRTIEGGALPPCVETSYSTTGMRRFCQCTLYVLAAASSRLRGGTCHSAGEKSGHSISSSSSCACACLLIAPHSTNVLTMALTSQWVKRVFLIRCSLWLSTWGFRPSTLARSSCVLHVGAREERTCSRKRSVFTFTPSPSRASISRTAQEPLKSRSRTAQQNYRLSTAYSGILEYRIGCFSPFVK